MDVRVSGESIGLVDHFDFFDTLGGWAKCSDDGSALPIAVDAHKNKTEVGRGANNIMRRDDRHSGFSVRLLRELNMADVISGRVRVGGAYEGCRRIVLPHVVARGL